MNPEKKDASERFYAFFSTIEPRQPKSNSLEAEWQAHVSQGAIAPLAPNLWHVTGTMPSAGWQK
jgi:hypothetical protein